MHSIYTDNDSKKKWFEIRYFECDCFGDDCLKFYRSIDPNDEPDERIPMVEVMFIPGRPLYRRIFDGIKYVIGMQVDILDVYILNRYQADEFREHIDRLYSEYPESLADPDSAKKWPVELADRNEYVATFTADAEFGFLEISLRLNPDRTLQQRTKRAWDYCFGGYLSGSSYGAFVPFHLGRDEIRRIGLIIRELTKPAE